MIRSVKIHISGIVQGVGFRPFVYREACKHIISGWVLNAEDGVHIRAEGEEDLVDGFILALVNSAPAASKVREIDIEDVPIENLKSFKIVYSDETEKSERTLVSPDIATCDNCKRELFDQSDRRYRYPFINCTNCGPRYTIIDDLPYDRDKTSMRDFEMCMECKREYSDPVCRRFHAQPNACFECGPHIYLKDSNGNVTWGNDRDTSDSIIATVVDKIDSGKIVAIKGLGGFHLACDANNVKAVARLRQLKGRDNKAFAVMMSSSEDARLVCEVSEGEEAILKSPEKPIVLLKLLKEHQLSESLICGLAELGVMLPYTPLQMLIMNDFSAKCCQTSNNPPMLVMTSGNISDYPIVISDYEANSSLAGIADCIVGNDREILTRFDDSVVRVLDFGDERSAVQMIRRARGYAPKPIELPDDLETTTLLAVGAEQKNTFALANKSEVFVSQHIGDMENAEVFKAWHESKGRLEKLFNLTDECDVVCDKHPEYLTSKWAFDHCSKSGKILKLTEVQHHHAHIVSAMAENNIAGPVLGFAFDGTGYGVDGAIWGGEVLLSNLKTYERFANLAYIPMPGGSGAIKNPMRMAYGLLYACDLLDSELANDFLARLSDEEVSMYDSMIEQGLNTPYTSSMGRLFDAVSALIRVCEKATYEGEPAVRLGALVSNSAETEPAYEFLIEKNIATEHSTALDTSVLVIDPVNVVKGVLTDILDNVDTATIASKFHNSIVEVVLSISQIVENLYGIKNIALSGGVWMNRYLIEKSVDRLARDGFNVILNKELPPNDGCISYGQAVVKCAQDN